MLSNVRRNCPLPGLLLIGVICLVVCSYLSQFCVSASEFHAQEVKFTAYNALKGSVEQISENSRPKIVARNTYSAPSLAPDGRKPVTSIYKPILAEADSRCINSFYISGLSQPLPGGIHSFSKFFHFLRILLI